jgi:hypothetical protein
MVRPASRNQPPLLAVAWQSKLRATLVILAYYVAGYFTLNRYPFERYFLVRETPLDQLPFVPWTTVIYNSVFILGALAIWLHSSRERLERYVLAVLASYTINYAFFAIAPTCLERPPPPESGSMWLWAARLTQLVDNPATCFPSLHMTNCFVAVLAYKGTGKARWFLLWSLAIGFSTLTTKQHVFWDLPAGFLVAVAGCSLAELLGRIPGFRGLPLGPPSASKS